MFSSLKRYLISTNTRLVENYNNWGLQANEFKTEWSGLVVLKGVANCTGEYTQDYKTSRAGVYHTIILCTQELA